MRKDKAFKLLNLGQDDDDYLGQDRDDDDYDSDVASSYSVTNRGNTNSHGRGTTRSFGGFGRGRGGLYRNTHIRNPTLQLQSIRSQNDIMLVMKQQFSVWGLQPNKIKIHADFEKAATSVALNCYEGQAYDWTPTDTSRRVPSDFSEGIEFILNHFLRRQTDNGERLMFSSCTDLIEVDFGENVSYPPYIYKSSNLSVNGVYANLPLEQSHLDPFSRFTYTKIPARDSISKSWSQNSNYFIEAAAIYESIHGSHACLRCGSDDALLFNCNLNVSFSDIVCSKCGSMYTIWGSTESAIKKKLNKRCLDKGRFFGDYILERKNLPSNGEIYVVLVGVNDSLQNMPAYAVQIVDVLPLIGSRTFNLEGTIRIMSKVILTACDRNIKPWFRLSLPNYSQDFIKSISSDIISTYFEEFEDSQQDKTEGADDNSVTEIDLTDEELRSRLRTLRRKRNRIESIIEKSTNGSELDSDELALLEELDGVKCDITKYQDMLR